MGFGSVVGRNPFFLIEETTKHHTNLYLVLNGQSSKARKGTSWNHIVDLLLKADPLFGSQLVSGLSTGEGIVNHLRDKAEEATQEEEESAVVVARDKRMLAVETEFTRVLKVMGRQGNTLSTLLRDAWDKGDFQILNKNSPMKATGAHFSIVGHTTDEDLQMTLDDCDLYNGFANRILWTAPRRAQFLPHGGNVDRAKLAVLGASLKGIISTAKGIGEMRRDDETIEQWDDVYHVLSAERAGLLGAVTNRAEAQVLRLSMIYALADGSRVIKLVHQKAALAAWDYCFRSAQRIFGSRLANHDAQKILEELRRRPEGMTRNQILDEVFFRNGSRADHDRAFEMLLKSELSYRKIESTGGRNAERWFAT